MKEKASIPSNEDKLNEIQKSLDKREQRGSPFELLDEHDIDQRSSSWDWSLLLMPYWFIARMIEFIGRA